MKPRKNPLLLAAAICLIVLAALCCGYAVATTLGVIRMMPSDAGSFQGTPQAFPGGSQDNGGRQQGAMPQGTPPSGFEGGSRPDGSTWSGNASGGFGAMGGFGTLRWVSVGLYGAALVLAVVAVVGILKEKKRGAILGVILAVVLTIVSAFGLFRLASGWSFALSLVEVLLGVAVIVLLLLPGARKAYAPKKDLLDDGEDDEDDEDDDVI